MNIDYYAILFNLNSPCSTPQNLTMIEVSCQSLWALLIAPVISLFKS